SRSDRIHSDPLKLREIADRLGCRLEGDGDIDIVRVAAIQHAEPGDLTFLANPRYVAQLETTRASAAIVALAAGGPAAACALLRTDDPYSAFARAVGLFAQTIAPARGVDRLSAIAPDAAIGADVSIGPFVSIGPGAAIGDRTVIFPNVVVGPGARIGDDCLIHSHATIRERVAIGNRVILHDGVVVRSDGFGVPPQNHGP